MKLISLAQGGETLPPTLPSTLVPPSKVKGGTAAFTTPTSLGTVPLPIIPGSPATAPRASVSYSNL